MSARGPGTPKAAAAAKIQKNYRGHSAKEKDSERVNQLKEEVRTLRMEEHIKHLSKELASAKEALDRERKLRSLQMDAIKVLWKEVQLMDEARCSSGGGGGGGGNNDNEVVRPSGRGGSKISTRSSEHSIAKLMETLEATSGGTAGSAMDNMMMAQSMPANVLASSLENNPVEVLSQTCNNLQGQVEQLQSSLAGVMSFMQNTFNNPAMPMGMGMSMSMMATSQPQQQPLQYQSRTRHSSTASTTDTVSFNYYPASNSNQQPQHSVGPVSLPIEPFQPPPLRQNSVPNELQLDAGLASSKSCDCLTQTDISAVLTPRNEAMPPAPNSFLHLKQVDIPLDTTSESESAGGVKKAEHQSRLKAHQEGQQQQQQQGDSIQVQGSRDRSKSPRPQTLPGLVKSSDSVPGLVQLAGTAVINSPNVRFLFSVKLGKTFMLFF